MASDDPREQKALGRKVSNFSDETWKKNCRKIVKKGNLAKFSQNSDLRAELLQTKGTTPVETGPRDTMWGIGLSAKSWKAQNRKYWRGKNLLGEILTEVRDELATGNDTND
ncbi:N-glycosidase R617 [Geodia barretti]|nr:N-glycosidase R617 [Geodia barretti]